MNLKLRLYFPTIFFIMVFNLSCISKKDIVYFQNDEIENYKSSNDYKLRFKPDDLLQITISSEDLLSVQPFNLPVVAYTTVKNGMFGQPQLQSYLIDSEGFIQFPVLGKIRVGGLTRSEVISQLERKLDPDYVRNPIININIINFKVTIQGDVGRPGTFTVPNERLSVFDAIGLAGDLNITAKRDNIVVVREQNDEKIKCYLDLKSNKVFSSPCYYLQQNDIVYVEPNNAKVRDASFSRQNGLWISVASIFISILTLITR